MGYLRSGLVLLGAAHLRVVIALVAVLRAGRKARRRTHQNGRRQQGHPHENLTLYLKGPAQPGRLPVYAI